MAIRLNRFRGGTRRRRHRPLGQQMPRPLSRPGVRRVLRVDGELVADASAGDQFAAVAHQGVHAAAARRVDAQPVVLVADLVAVQRFPAVGVRARRESVGSPPQRRDVTGQPGDGVAAVLDDHRYLPVVGVEQHSGERFVEVNGGDVGAAVRQRVPHDHRAIDRSRQQRQRVVPRRRAELPGVAPAGQQVEVHLVGFGAGDRVVVGSVGQLYPRLRECRLGIRGPGEQSGEHRESFRLQYCVLGGAVGLLGVDVGDVAARVDRIHVARLG